MLVDSYQGLGVADLYLGSAESCYHLWPDPVAIISDGPYGIVHGRGGYAGDTNKIDDLVDFYLPHIKVWTERAASQTTLWFWNSEEGWANVHHTIIKYGWEYRGVNVWDKGIGHIAGNCNTKTLRKFPTVTEICVHYTRPTAFRTKDGSMVTIQDWLRNEWLRTGLPLNESNKACGVKNAATRKYLTTDHLWYMPPIDVYTKLMDYANTHGKPEGRPYFKLSDTPDGSCKKYETLRAKFKLPLATTNVWQCNRPSGKERISINGKNHPNQKPLSLMRKIICASTDCGDVIWEPFAGTATASKIALETGRSAHAAENDELYYELARKRMTESILQGV